MTSAARDRISIAREPSVAADATGLGATAFQADPDPRFVYSHLGLQRVCAELLAFDLSERPGCLLITGAAGAGKSILLRSILEERRLGEDCHLVSCAGGLSFEALVTAWCAALRLGPKARAQKTRLAALHTYLAARNKQAGSATLLLDDAEFLDRHALKELCDLAGGKTVDRRLVRIVLAMRPEPAVGLADPERAALPPSIAFRASLEAMNEAEVEAYIRHRLVVAGCETPDELFSAPAIEIVARASLGVPRLINVICRTALAVARAGRLATVSTEQIEVAIQACMLHAQESLAAQDVLPLPNIPAAGAETTPAAVVARPIPPRPEPSWPMVVDFDAAADEASGRGVPAKRWPRRLLRSAPGLLAGLLFGLSVATLFPARLQMPAAVPPSLLLSAEDEKARLIAEPIVTISKTPVETPAPEAEPAVLEVEPWIGPAVAPAPVVLSPGPSVTSQPPEPDPDVEASEPPEEESAPEVDPAVLDREPWIGTPEIEAEPVPEPPREARAPEEAPAAPVRKPRSEAPKIEAEPATPASQRPLETRTSDVPVASPPEKPAATRTPKAQPAVPVPKPPVKPRLFLGRDKPAAAAPETEVPVAEAEAAGNVNV